MAFQQFSLNSGWQFRSNGGGDSEWREATVPGCVHTDILNHGLIPDPFFGRNEFDLQWIEEADWDYRLIFDADRSLLESDHLELVCEGLDTVATVRLNGDIILQSDNMFHRHRLDVKGLLRPYGNFLEIRFDSAMEYIRSHRTDFVVRESNDPVGGCTRIRKQQCQFGWDWGPRFVTCGIWRSIHLEGWSRNRLDSVRIEQKHEAGEVELAFHPELARAFEGGVFRATVSLDGEIAASGEFQTPDFSLRIPNHRLWWPVGQGAQPLYDVTVELQIDGGTASQWSRRIGLRTIVLDCEPDGFDVKNSKGIPLNRFGFRVNGRLIFSKGANWIPAHSFVAGLTRSDYEPLLSAAVDANMNMMRVWGGGIYEHEAFYDLCDELGLLVWQDFMFACTQYPADEAFLASSRREARDEVTRLRHHASIALWCGNNEIVAMNNGVFAEDPVKRDGYVALFLDALPDALRECERITPYLHSSPCYPISGLPESQLLSQDEHDWNVWHERRPVGHYETTSHRFVSEFGMQSYPSPQVAATFCPPEDLNILSPVFEAHQKNAAGNAIIFHYVAELFRYPCDYKSLSYLSQLNQAYCMKAAIEHFRRQQPQCLGALYWQINDCWPVASWSSIEFGGNWKALHHYARRFFAPVLVSIKLRGEEKTGIGNNRHNTRGEVELWTISDAPERRSVTLSWQLLTPTGEVLAQGEETCQLDYGEARLQTVLDFSAELGRVGKNNALLLARLLDANTGEEISRNIAFFTTPRLLDLARKPIAQTVRRLSPCETELTLSAPVFHYAVCVELEAGETVSDNFFHLTPGETKVITIRCAVAGEREPRVFSLVDTY